MKQFYQSSYYFWITSKSIFAIAGLVSAIQLLQINNLKPDEKLANFVGVLYCILMMLDVIFLLNKKYYKYLSYTIGTLSIILGLIIFVVMMKVKVVSIIVTFIFVIWIILLGFFDLLQIKKIEIDN